MELRSKFEKKVKIGKLYKKLKKPAKMLIKVLGGLGRMFCSTAVQRYKDDNLAFMTCILKVKVTKRGWLGWQKSVIKLLKNCQGVRFQMDENGRVEVTGIANPDKLLWKIGRSKKIELQWIQFGQCSSNLFLKQETATATATAKDPPLKNNYPHQYRGYGYPPPALFRQLPPYYY